MYIKYDKRIYSQWSKQAMLLIEWSILNFLIFSERDEFLINVKFMIFVDLQRDPILYPLI